MYTTWDFSQANPDLTNEALIKALLQCLEKTAGDRIGLYSKFKGIDRFPEFQKLIVAKFPEQTNEQKEQDSRGQ